MEVMITKAVAVLWERDVLTAGMVGKTVRVKFSEDWEALSRTVVFRAGDETRDVIADPTGLVAEVVIPHEVLVAPERKLCMGVYGTDSTGSVVVPTVWCELGVVRAGADPSGDEGAEPTPDAWSQAMGRMAGLEKELAELDAVRYGTTQALTSAQQTRGRSNIGAASAGELSSHMNAKNPHGLTYDQVGAAPAGFGYGETMELISTSGTEEEFDELLEAVFSQMSTHTAKQIRFYAPNVLTNSYFIGTLYRPGLDTYGILRGQSYIGSRGHMVSKMKYTGQWLPFEWENPAMMADTEYRTTKRYLGKPVYTKMIYYTHSEDIDENVSGIEIPHGISDLNQIVSVDAVLNTSVGLYQLPYIGSGNRSISVEGYTAESIWIRCREFDTTGFVGQTNWGFVLNYTKTS